LNTKVVPHLNKHDPPPRNEELVAPLSPRTALFQENSLNQILFDQKFSKLDLTQKRHVQND